MAGTTYTFTVDGAVPTYEDLIAKGIDLAYLGLHFDVARGLPQEMADKLDGVLRQARIPFERAEAGAAGYSNDELKGTARG